MNDHIKKLDEFSEIILKEEVPIKLRAACQDFYEFLCGLVGLVEDFNDSSTYNGTILAQGKAISPLNAARCLWEFKRTYQFIRGISTAIEKLKNRFPNEKIEILYAGCGPFATLLIPLLRKLSPNEINLTLLDYHDFSIKAAQKIFQIFGFEKFNAEFIQTDACTYRHPRKLHLVITETMQNALVNETQTAITQNLAPQVCNDGIFVPQNIKVSACFINSSKEFSEEKERYFLGMLLNLDAEKIKNGRNEEFSAVSFEIPPEVKTKKLSLSLLTKIRIFDDFKLDDYDSSISYPKTIQKIDDFSEKTAVEFEYVLDEKPHFKCRFF